MIGRCQRCRRIVEDLYTSRGEYLCEECFSCDLDEDDFDADELGLDPEEPYDA